MIVIFFFFHRDGEEEVKGKELIFLLQRMHSVSRDGSYKEHGGHVCVLNNKRRVLKLFTYGIPACRIQRQVGTLY